MGQQNWSTPRLTDREIIQSLKKVHTVYEVDGTITAIGDVSVSVRAVLAGDSAVVQHLSESDDCAIFSVAIALGHLQFNYVRGDVDRNQPRSILDNVSVSIAHGVVMDELARIAAVRLMQQQWPPVRLAAQSNLPIESLLSESVAAQAATVDRLNRVAADVIRDSADYRQQLERTAAEEQSRQNAAFGERYKKLEDLFDQRQARLEAAELELAKEKAALDDRHNTHVRRAIREQLLADVKERTAGFSLSLETEAKRVPVINGILALLILTGTLAAHALYLEYFRPATGPSPYAGAAVPGQPTASAPAIGQVASNSEFGVDRAVNLTRFALATFGFFGTLLFYVKWQDRWARRHEEAELQLRQFQLDVNRASWVVETCLEWNTSTKSDVSPELLSAMSRGLFSGQGNVPEPVVHPADALASALLGSASKLKLRSGESEVEINNPGKKIPATVGLGSDEAKK